MNQAFKCDYDQPFEHCRTMIGLHLSSSMMLVYIIFKICNQERIKQFSQLTQISREAGCVIGYISIDPNHSSRQQVAILIFLKHFLFLSLFCFVYQCKFARKYDFIVIDVCVCLLACPRFFFFFL